MIVRVNFFWKKSYLTEGIVYMPSLSKLETVLQQAVGGRLNDEFQTP